MVATTPTASRRIDEVWSPEYSAVALPSRWRAAPAKKAMVSTLRGDGGVNVGGLSQGEFGHDGTVGGIDDLMAGAPGRDRRAVDPTTGNHTQMLRIPSIRLPKTTNSVHNHGHA